MFSSKIRELFVHLFEHHTERIISSCMCVVCVCACVCACVCSVCGCVVYVHLCVETRHIDICTVIIVSFTGIIWSTHTNTHVRTNAHTHIYTQTHTYTHKMPHTHTKCHTRARTRAHTHTHTHTELICYIIHTRKLCPVARGQGVLHSFGLLETFNNVKEWFEHTSRLT